MKAGDLVMFRTPLDESERNASFVVLEMRFDRVLVMEVDSRLPLPVKRVFSTADLVPNAWAEISSEDCKVSDNCAEYEC